ncbi:MAG TPA: hypothetical protein VN823_27805 [Stellaceae bacterium]|nr:hypothetical protein [Stellaceae bacterium]
MGDTPAYRLTHRAMIGVFPKQLTKRFALPPVTSEWSPPVVLFPDVPMMGAHERQTNFSATELAGIRDRSMDIYIFGEVKYRDAFRKRRWLKFCSRIHVNRDADLIALSSNSTNIFEIAYHTAPIGNDAN